MPSSIIQLANVSRLYDDGQVTAVSDVSLALERGAFLAVTGASGSGKSTLLNLMSGLDRPTSGRVLFDGLEPGTRRAWAGIRARRIGFVFQRFNLLATLTARENIEVAMFGVVRSTRDRARRAADLLARVGLTARAGHHPHRLSVGERQRVAIARSLANSPDVILADEPTGNLDTRSAASVMDLLEDIHGSDGLTLVVVTHDARVAARARRHVLLEDGRVVSNDAS